MRYSRLLTLVLASRAVAGCSDGSGDGTTGPSPQKATVVFGHSPGVTGSPAGDSVVVDSGTVVRYSFTTITGYANLEVRLDANSVSPTGTFVARSRHILLATSDSILIFPAQDSVFLHAAKAMLTAPDLYAGYLTYQSMVDSLIRAVGYEVARARIAVVEAESFHPVDDANTLADLARVVAESSVARGVPQFPNRHDRPSANVVPEVVFLYVNGVGFVTASPASDFQLTVGEVDNLVRAAGFTDPSKFEVGGFYNPSVRFISQSTLRQLVCFGRKAALLALSQVARLLRMSPCPGGQHQDIAESVIQVWKAVTSQPPGANQADVLRLADSISGVLSRGSKVVLLVHSQGNLFAQQALTAISQATLGQQIDCVGVVGVSPPTSIGWPVNPSAVSQLIAAGVFSKDILLQIGLPNDLAVRIPTTTTSKWDQRWPLLFLLPVFVPWAGIDIHPFDKYYNDGTGLGTIISALRDMASATAQACPARVGPVPPTALTGQTAGSSDITVAWTDNASDEDGFVLELANSPNGPFTVVALPGIDAQSSDIGGLDPSTLYYLRIAATREGVLSPYSNVTTARTVSPFPTYAAGMSMLAIDSMIYSFGLWRPYVFSSGSFAYDPSIDQWSTLQPYASGPGQYSGVSSAAAIGGKAHIVGGVDQFSTMHSEHNIYDPASDTWTAGPPYPIPTAGGVAGSIGGMLYVYAGILQITGHSSDVNAFYAFDPSSRVWTQLRPPPWPRTGTGGAIGGRFYLIGGYDTTGAVTGSVDIYDPVTNTWTAGATMPTPRVYMSSAVNGNQIHVVGGWVPSSGGCGHTRTIEVYDAVLDSWSMMPGLRRARSSPGVAILSDKLYVIGGSIGCYGLPTDVTSDVEILGIQ